MFVMSVKRTRVCPLGPGMVYLQRMERGRSMKGMMMFTPEERVR